MKRWYFWVLAPVMLGSAAIIGMNNAPTLTGKIIGYGIALVLILATIGLASPVRFLWALRGVAAGILVAYLGYTVSEFVAVLHGKAIGWTGGPGEVSLRNALLGLLVFGFPAARFFYSGKSGTVIDTLACDQQDATDESTDESE